MDKNISQITLDKIKELKVKPISRNVFFMKKLLFWVLVGLSVVIGSISFAITISFLINNDWNLYNRFGFSFILRTLPYFWFVFLGLFIFLGEFYYKKTFLGYRHRSIVIVGTYLLTTIIIGSIIYSVRVEEFIEESLYKTVPIYRNVTFDRKSIWSQPEEGLLSGQIILIGENRFKLVDQNGLLWDVRIGHDCFIGRQVYILEGERVKIIGDIESGQLFIAREIRPWFNNIGKMNLLHKGNSLNRPLEYKMR